MAKKHWKLKGAPKEKTDISGTSVNQLRGALNSGMAIPVITRLAKLRHRRGLRGYETTGFAN